MTRKSLSRTGLSNVVAFPDSAGRARGGGRAALQNHKRALLARTARLDPSLLDRQSLRLVTVLASPEARGRLDEASAQVTLIGRKGGVSLALGQSPQQVPSLDDFILTRRKDKRITEEITEALCKTFWLKREHESKRVFYVLTPLARQALADDTFVSKPAVACTDGRYGVPLHTNQKESPLLWLARRKNSQGIAHVSPAQLLAGERLRQDYTQAGMTPKMTANWSGLPVAGPVTASGLHESERMLDARQRVRSALEACGSPQAGLLLDICCFLKPLEQVERDRGWRARTGKYALVKALICLAQHYGLSDTAQGPLQAARITVWKA